MFNWHLDSGRGNANSLRAMWFHLQISCGLTAANGAALLGSGGGDVSVFNLSCTRA